MSRVYDVQRKKQQDERSELRAEAHATGDRSDKIRTYNFQQDRVTDHRMSSISLPGPERLLSTAEGLSELSDALHEEEGRKRLLEFLSNLS